ncbi:MAG: TonB-dependent receptor [Leeuwenhoekiella sp.]
MKSLLLVLFFAWFTWPTLAQNVEVEVQGLVKDPAGMPLPGVNVLLKGTSQGTSTDFNGNYSITVNQGDILVFSYVGFKNQEFTITENQTLNVTLQEDASVLDDVVVIGYGTQSKKETTGAVSVVSSETIEEQNPVRVEQALQGRVAGVNVSSTSGSPGSASTISIRGISTNGDNRPLILLDGAVIEDLSVLNPNDIESINILKDATAGIYGVRAANGVILITTKGGRKDMPLQISLDAYTGFQETTRKLPVLNATEYAIIINEAFAAGGLIPPFSNFSSLGRGTDWQDIIFQTAPISDVNLNIAGGSKKATYSFGAGYLSQDGIVGGDAANFERLTLRTNFNYDILENLKLNTTAIYTHSNRSTLLENALGSVLFNAINFDPLRGPFDEAGEFTIDDLLGIEVINPVAQVANSFNGSQVDKITGTIGLAYDFWDNFKVESRYQFNYSEVNGDSFTQTGLDYGTSKVFNNVDGQNVYVVNSNYFRDYTIDNFLTYENTFGDDHNVKALLGHSVFKTTGDFFTLTGRGLTTNSFDTATLEGAAEIEDAREINPVNSFDSRLLSYFVRLQYNYQRKYLLSLVFRRDGSSNFGPENKFGYFPSASAGWVLSDEDFFGSSKTLNFFKLRGSYGVLGNDRIAPFGFVSLIGAEGTYVFDDELVNGTATGALSNPEIRWEKQKAADIGFDAQLFNNAVDLTVDYFNRETEDLLLQPQVSGILGVGAPGAAAPTVNAGTVRNRGLEVAINYKQVVTDDFDFNIGYNFTTIDNEVLFVGNENGFVPGGGFGIGQEPPSRMEAGFPIGYFYGLQTNGIFQNQDEVDANAEQANAVPGDLRFVDQNGDGLIDSDDRVYVGDPIPDVTMGLNVGFNYKNFDFTAYAFASIGNDIVRNFDRNQVRTNKTSYVLNRWTGEGSTNSYPRVTTGANSNLIFSDFYVEDGSYLRLQNVQLGYSFGQNLLEQIGIKKLRFYVAVNNLLTLTKYTGYDPSASSGAPIGGGIDQGFYPVPRIYMGGINFKF